MTQDLGWLLIPFHDSFACLYESQMKMMNRIKLISPPNIIVFVLVILTFFPMLEVGVTNPDDAYNFLEHLPDKAAGETTVWQKYKNSVTYGDLQKALRDSHGRFTMMGNYLLKPITILGTGLGSFKLRRVAGIFSIILSMGLFFYLLKVYFHSSRFGMMFLLFFLVMVQNAWEYTLPISYPVGFHTALCILFLSVLLLHKPLREGGGKYWEIVSGIFYFLALIMYESFIFYSIILFLLVFFYSEEKGQLLFNRILLSLNKLKFHIILSVVYLIFYYLCKMYYSDFSPLPNDYQFVFDSRNFLKVVWQYAISSFPTYYYFNEYSWLSLYSEAFDAHSVSLYHLLKEARVEWLVKGILSGYLAYHLLGINEKLFTSSRFFGLILIAFLAIILPICPLALSEKYQYWVTISGSNAHTVTHFAFFGTVLLLTTLILGINQRLIQRNWANNIFRLSVAVGIFFVCIATDYSNRSITLSQTQCHFRWRVFDEFLKTREFDRVPNGSVIYAPTLYGGINHMVNHEPYWSRYAKKRAGKDVEFVSGLEKVFQTYGRKESQDLFFYKYSQELKDPNQFIIFSKIEDIVRDGSKICIASNEAHIYTLSKYKNFRIFFATCNARENQEIMIDGRHLNLSSRPLLLATVNKQGLRDEFVKTVLVAKNIDLESITLSHYAQDGYDNSILKTNFKEGFYGLEGDNKHNWRWCGKSGVLYLRNISDEELTLMLSTGISAMLGSKMHIRSSIFNDDLVMGSGGGISYKKSFKLPPMYELKISFFSDAPRVRAPDDPRYMVFHLSNFTISVK